ncbi:MAG: protein kinase [Phycisphaerales bacterium]|nr:protein kinase [Phycisphaerales bacterium]
MTNHSHPSAPTPATPAMPPSGPSSKTPRTERELIEQALDQAHSPRSDGFSFPGDMPAAGTFPGYELIREIHRGGQGAVFLAVQLATKRRVAIKLMHGGPFRGSAGKARFEREVQILGQLNHPNIVRIHDSGMTIDGSHYYVMDYVSGRSLDELIALEKRPPVEETLRQFLKICEGINAAHLKGIIHRDIKPSNIRISNSGDPIVVDFGLAKVALPGGSSDQTPAIMSMTGQFIGSLPWASPEQAEGVHDNVDVRTDVYSLGIVLYQLLTGKFPYDVIGNMRDVLDRILRAEPARPSTVRRQINDEVETIVLKCLAKDRDRRYQSAGELARDIERYLAGQPIEAKRDSIFYVISKTARRYWVPAATLTSMIAAIAIFAVVMSVLYQQKAAAESGLSRSLGETNRLKNEAVENLAVLTRLRDSESRTTAEAQTLARQLLFEFDPTIENLIGGTTARLNLLKIGKQYLASLKAEPEQTPEIVRYQAEANERLGKMMASLLEKKVKGTAEGVELLAEAKRLREQLAARAPDDPVVKAELATCMRLQAEVLRLDGKADEAQPVFEASLAMYNELLDRGELSDELRRKVEEERCDNLQGLVLTIGLRSTSGKITPAASQQLLDKEAEPHRAAAEEYWLSRLSKDPQNPDLKRAVLSSRNWLMEWYINGLAKRLRTEKQFKDAEAVLLRVEAACKGMLDEAEQLERLNPQHRDIRRDLGLLYQYIGWTFQDRARGMSQQTEDDITPPEGVPLLIEEANWYAKSLKISDSLASSERGNQNAKRDLVLAYNKVGNAQSDFAQTKRDLELMKTARETHRESLRLRREMLASDPITRHRRDVGTALVKMGDIERNIAEDSKDPAEKKKCWTDAIEFYEEALRASKALEGAGVAPFSEAAIKSVNEYLRKCRKGLLDLEKLSEQK